MKIKSLTKVPNHCIYFLIHISIFKCIYFKSLISYTSGITSSSTKLFVCHLKTGYIRNFVYANNYISSSSNISSSRPSW